MRCGVCENVRKRMQIKIREYEMVRMVFKETNNKMVARKDVGLWSYKVLISSPNISAHLVDC